MVTTVDEDWSIISSSDYEEDSSQSDSHQDISEISKYKNQDKSAAVSEISVRSIGDTGCSTENAICVKHVSALKSSSGYGAGQLAQSALASPDSGFARKSLFRVTTARSWGHTTQLFRKTDKIIKNQSRKMFGSSLTHLHGRLDLSSSCAVQKVSVRSMAFWKIRQSYILYFLIIAGITAVLCGVVAFWSLFRYTPPSTPSSYSISTLWEIESRHKIQNHFGFSSVNLWCKTQMMWYRSIGKSCYGKSYRVMNSALFKNVKKQRSFCYRFFSHAPSKRLRFATVWENGIAHLRDLIKSTRVIVTIKFFKKSLLAHYNFLRAQLKYPVANQKVFTWAKIFASSSAGSFTQMLRVSALKTWKNILTVTKNGLSSGLAFFGISSSPVKPWCGKTIIGDARHIYLLETKLISRFIESKYSKLASYVSQWSNQLQLIALHCQTRIYSTGKLEQLLIFFEKLSCKSVDIAKKRLKIAAVDLFRLSKKLYPSVYCTNTWKREFNVESTS